MTTRLSVNINGDTQRILRWAELERDLDAEQVLRIGARLLAQIDRPDHELQAVHQDGTIERIDRIIPTLPGEAYGF